MKRIPLLLLGLSLGFATSALAGKDGGGGVTDVDSDGLCDAIDLSVSDDLIVVYVDDGMADCEVALDDGSTLTVSQDEETSTCEAGAEGGNNVLIIWPPSERMGDGCVVGGGKAKGHAAITLIRRN